MICTIRIPDVLQGRIDMAAGDDGRSKWILEACRMRLDGVEVEKGESPMRGEAKQHDERLISETSSASSLSPTVTAVRGKVPAQVLRDICAGLSPTAHLETGVSLTQPYGGIERGSIEIPICGKTWWEDGEQYECLMDKGHRETNHGMRGMVRKLDA